MLYHVSISREVRTTDGQYHSLSYHAYDFETLRDAQTAYTSHSVEYMAQAGNVGEELRINDTIWWWQGSRDGVEYNVKMWKWSEA